MALAASLTVTKMTPQVCKAATLSLSHFFQTKSFLPTVVPVKAEIAKKVHKQSSRVEAEVTQKAHKQISRDTSQVGAASGHITAGIQYTTTTLCRMAKDFTKSKFVVTGQVKRNAEAMVE